MPANGQTGARLTVEDWGTLQSRLVWAYDGAVPPENRRSPTREGFLAAWWLRRGGVVLRKSGWTWRARAGEWMLLDAAGAWQEFSDDAEILSVSFRLEWPSGDALLREPLVLPAGSAPELGRAATALVKLVRREFPGVRLDLWRTEVGMETYFALQQLFSRWVRAYLAAVVAAGVTPERMGGLDPRVMAALRELDRWPWSRAFRERELAARVGLSAGHLDRLFVQGCAVTPRAYLQKRRLESARAALGDENATVKQVAYALGFGSAAHFCRWFKQATGLTPGEARGAGH